MTVITTFPYYPEWEVPKVYAGRLTAEEDRHGVRLLRSYVYARPRPTAILRALFYLSFTLSCLPNLIKAGKHDVVLIMSPPPTLVFSVLVSRVLHRARLVLDVQDIVPDAAVIFRMMSNPFLIAIFRWVERICEVLQVDSPWVPQPNSIRLHQTDLSGDSIQGVRRLSSVRFGREDTRR